MIDGFRGKIARSWWNPWGEFHPLRGLAWLMRFRVAQAAAALILLTAMIGGRGGDFRRRVAVVEDRRGAGVSGYESCSKRESWSER